MTAAVPATIGILMLKTGFPRPVGDIGNPASWDLPAIYRTVPAATVDSVVRTEGAGADVLAGLVEAMAALEADGATFITTGCGFLGTLQSELAAAAAVPVLTNSLCAIPRIRAALGADTPIGVLTFDSRKLTPAHFAGGWDKHITIEGVEGGRELYPVISQDRPTLDEQAAEADVLDATARLIDRAPDLAAIVMECTNLGPYRAAVAARAGVPVHDIVSTVSAAVSEKSG